MKLHVAICLLASTMLFAACGDDEACTVETGEGCEADQVCRAVADGDPACFCNPVANTGCEDAAQACEEVQGGNPGCFAPLVMRGRVFDLSSNGAVEGAHVVALDVNGAVVSTVAVTDANGAYELGIPTLRQADGAPIGAQLKLRADAAGYATFPSGLRQALPIDTGANALVDGKYVVMSATTDVGLTPLPAGAGDGQIHGSVEVPADFIGVLVVAESSTGTGFTALADRSGGYRIFNLPPATYTVKAYARGVNYDPVMADVPAAGDVAVDLAINDQAASTLSGTASIVNPGMGTGTSVVLIVESTFNEALVRGEVPPGLRAPEPGIEPNVSGAFSIAGVPAGRYVVLAAFENDFLVRDPDPCIAGTAILHQEVVAGQDVEVSESFKVTGSLDVIAPGAMLPEPVTGTPTFSWKDDSSEDEYELVVLDTFGNTTWETIVPGASGDDPMVPYAGPALMAGMYYQFRATSVRVQPDKRCKISQTEDLKGVFFVP